LIKGLHGLGHRVLFLEKDQPWYAAHRDAAQVPFCNVQLYASNEDLRERFGYRIRNADAVIVGSYVDRGIEVCDWVLDAARGVRAFYDIDTPVTLSTLERGECTYLTREQVGRFDMILSFSGGGVLDTLRRKFGARIAHPLYCSVDPELYRPQPTRPTIDLGYMGTYSADRQVGLERLLITPAKTLPAMHFAVVGAQYPQSLTWPPNVAHRQHLAPDEHEAFYGSQRFTLNLTRDNMRAAGYSPSVRLFEAAACATPVISDEWPGIDEFFTPGEEILIARQGEQVATMLTTIADDERQRLAARARQRVLALHTGAYRAQELERHIFACMLPDAVATNIPQARTAAAHSA
jgi:spore maturation protein CgeB